MTSLHRYAKKHLSGLLALSGLTDCESQVAELMFHRLCSAAIAAELGVELSTVRAHKRAVYLKLSVNGEADLMVAISAALWQHHEAPNLVVTVRGDRALI